MTDTAIAHIKEYRTVVFSVIGRKLGNAYCEDYDDAYQYASIKLLEILQDTIIPDNNILGYLLRFSWEYMSMEQTRRVREQTEKYDNNRIDSIESSTTDDLVNMFMDAPVKRAYRVDYNNLLHFDVFKRSLPPRTLLVVDMRMRKESLNNIKAATGKNSKHIAVVDYNVRVAYKKWIVRYMKLKNNYNNNLCKIIDTAIKAVAELVISGYRSSVIAEKLNLPKNTASCYVHFARRVLNGEAYDSVIKYRVPVKPRNRLRRRTRHSTAV